MWTLGDPAATSSPAALAGASAGLAYLAELRGNDVLARRAWAAALLGIAVSPALLISDLGGRARFLNMLRMFKVTSPMSVGSWILAASGAATAVAAANAWLGWFPRAGQARAPGRGAARAAAVDLHRGADGQHRGPGVARGAAASCRSCSASGAALSAGAAAAIGHPDRARRARPPAGAGRRGARARQPRS